MLDFHDWLFVGLTAFNVVWCMTMFRRTRIDANETAYEQGFENGFDRGFDAGWDECELCEETASDDQEPAIDDAVHAV